MAKHARHDRRCLANGCETPGTGRTLLKTAAEAHRYEGSDRPEAEVSVHRPCPPRAG